MSSKFFTWSHKGDKKPSPYGVVPIPAECITISGIDTKASHRSKRKPLPLDLYSPPESTSNDRSIPSDSFALHDAAVQSATSLLAVINDCLKSPQLNAHLMSNQQHAAGLQPMHGRPRSRTAPPTPVVEAPPGKHLSPVELPASMPEIPSKKSHKVHQSMDSKGLRSIMVPPIDSSTPGDFIERPHSSPQDTSYRLPSNPRQSSDSFSRQVYSLQPPVDPVPRAKTSSPYRKSRPNKPNIFNTSDDTLVASEAEAMSSTTKRPSLNVLSSWRHDSPGNASSKSNSRSNSTNVVPQATSSNINSSRIEPDPALSPDGEGALMEQISAIRTAHELHLKSLKEAHEKEIASHRSYITFLEKRNAKQATKQHLTIDTSHIPNRDPSLLSSEASATNSMQSFESTLENQKRASSEAAAEAQKLRRERDSLKDSSERNERRVSQLKDIVRKAKENEKALKNAVAGLEAALVSANNERLDVLEGFHEACEQVRLLGKECDESRNRLYYADPTWQGNGTADQKLDFKAEPADMVQRKGSLRSDPLIQQLDELRHAIAERDARIRELMGQVEVRQPPTGTGTQDGADGSTHNSFEEQLQECKQQLAAAQDDRDRYNSLLHAELRRQSKSNTQTATPRLKSEPVVGTQDRLGYGKHPPDAGSLTSDAPSNGHSRLETLERELKHYLDEIVLYKLDIKGYKKDLKLANTEIETLRTTVNHRPKILDSSVDSSSSSRRPSNTAIAAKEPASSASSSGLGIMMPQAPATPQKAAKSSALLSSTTTPQQTQPIQSSPLRPKTPLGAHKKLPKPPPQSRTPSPYLPYSPPTTDVQRQETLRSLSESIISSYAKRSTPEQTAHDASSPPRERSSDPLRATPTTCSAGFGRDAIAVPFAKVTPEMLKTPVRMLGEART